MKGDYVTFRIAAGRSLLGAGLQIVLAVALLIYGVLSPDHGAVSASIYVGAGVVTWLALAILFDQHRRQRMEALEAESLAATRGASVFESDGAEFQVALKRLGGMYRVVLPVVAFLIGAGLIGAGIVRFVGGRALVSPDSFPTPGHRGWAVAIGLGVAFVGFVYARFAAGMAKQPLWSNMRAGAAWSVGSALCGLAIAVGAFVDMAGPDAVSRYLQVIVPGAMVALGGEILLNLVLELYRPRKPGEMPRVAMDSHVLGFAAAPDRIAKSISDAINYQLGFDVSSTWFYRLLSRSLSTLVLMALVLLWALSSVSVLEPHQRGIVLRFGALAREVGPGWNWKWPWPIERVEVPEFVRRDAKGRVNVIGRTATGVRTLDLGTAPPANEQKAILWTNEHATDEVFQIVQPGETGAAAASAGQNDIALVSVEIPLHYVVNDVVAYDRLAAPEVRDDLLRAYARREIVRFFSGRKVDDVLAGSQRAMSSELEARVGGSFRRIGAGSEDAGVKIMFLGVTGAHPPQKAAAAFERVVQAEQKREARLEGARMARIQKLTEVVGSVDRADAIVEALRSVDAMREAGAPEADVRAQEFKVQQLIDEAGGRAASVIAAARADRWTRHMGERGRAARYAGQLASYEASPAIFMASLYFDALAAAMADARVYITSDRVPDLRVRLELQDRDTGVDVFAPKKEGDE